MLAIDNEKAAKIERLADMLFALLEKVTDLAYYQADDQSQAFSDLVEAGGREDVKEAKELFKTIANARTDKHMLLVHPVLEHQRKVITMLLINEYNSQPTGDDSRPNDQWIRERMEELAKAVEE